MAAWLLLRLGIGAFLAMNVMMLSLVLYTTPEKELGISTVRGLHWVMLALSTPVLAILGGPFLAGSLRGLRHAKVGMDILIFTGSTSAYLVSAHNTILGNGNVYFDTSTMLLLIVTLGRLLEATAKNRTSTAIHDVMDLIPNSARVIRGGVETEIPSLDIQVGDLIVVRPGENVSADGRIISGECSITETAFTGEAKPRSCSPGDTVYGGSTNHDGLITVKATATGTYSLLGQVQQMVQHAQRDRAPIEQLAERMASVFVPAVWIAAIGAALYWGLLRGDIERASLSALAVLVVACPCALGLATPIATSLAIGRAARSGVLIRSGEVLERLPAIRTVYFDKTGTLTTGSLSVSEIDTASMKMTQEQLLAWTAAVESGSEHAVARAVVSESIARGVGIGELTEFAAIPGHGAEGEVLLNGNTRRVTVGSLRYLSQRHSLPESLHRLHHSDSITCVYVGWDNMIQARISLLDRTRPEAAQAISALKTAGIRTAIISGDHGGPTERVARDLGIDEVFAERSPADKAELIRDAVRIGQGGVAMVGDGINDAPALAVADVGIAIGGGTDLARQSSDLILMGDDVSRIPVVLALSHLTYRVIRQNLLWAFGYNSIAISAAFFGHVHPLIAALAMLLSSSAVITNSMRIQRWTPSSGRPSTLVNIPLLL